jgi:hypothetical protein
MMVTYWIDARPLIGEQYSFRRMASQPYMRKAMTRRCLVPALILSAVLAHANGTAAEIVRISGMGPSGTSVVNPAAKKE